METQNFYFRLRGTYRNLTPLFEKPQVGAYTMLILSIFTVAFFSAFAIRPALVEIGHLKKEIEDKQTIKSGLDDKIDKLRLADKAYQEIKPELTAVFSSLPKSPEVASLLGKFNRALIEHNIAVTALQFNSIVLTPPQTASPSASIIGFTLTGQASYENALSLVNLLSRIDRIVTIDSVDLSSDEGEELLTVVVKGKSYALWEGEHE